MKAWWGASELAGLKGLPATVRGVSKIAARQSWIRRKRRERGGGYEYSIDSLPPDTRNALIRREVRKGDTLPAPREPLKAEQPLKDWQQETLRARAAILSEIDGLVLAGAGKDQAVRALVQMAKEKALPDHLALLVPIANARAGNKQTLSRATLYNWMRERRDGGVEALSPAPVKEEPIPSWAGPLMRHYARPQKPSLAWAVEELARELAPGGEIPSYDQARRFVKRLGAVARNQGRMGPRALKSMKAYVARDVSELWPTAIYTADGHTFDGEVAHPIHGKPFRPEITAVIDVFTRRIVGWSAALSENTWGVLDAARHAFQTSGVCDLWYVDRGKGFNNAAFDAELTGFLARLSITKKNSLPYNSQARGVVERLHQSVWVRGAKQLPTYMGAAMDPEARQRAFKITRAQIRDAGTSRLLMSWADFVDWAQAQVDAYNARPQSSLPKTVDPESGRRRSMTPDEAWALARSEGFEPDVVAEAEAVDLFRPYEQRKARRGLVSLFGNSYFSRELEPFHDEDVLVGYDIHDASRVWVRAMDGRAICVATFEGNKQSFFPRSVAEAAHERRVQGRLNRLERRRREVEEEAGPLQVIDHASVEPLDPEDDRHAEDALDRLLSTGGEAPTVIDGEHGRPLFPEEIDWVRWLLANPQEATREDGVLLRDRLGSSTFRTLLDCEGVAATTLQDLVKQLTEAA